MKGGYQIIDLSKATAGDPVNIKGAYEAASKTNEKPVMIITADDQRVFAQMKKDGSDYKTTYVTGDGYTISVKIESDDDVTLTSTNETGSIELLEQAVNELSGKIDDLTNESGTGTVDVLEDRVDANKLNAPVDIKNYDGSTLDKFYTTPSDGYVRIGAVGADVVITLQIKGKNGIGRELMKCTGTGDQPCVFVKKGFILSIDVGGTGEPTSVVANFYGIE